MKSIVWCINIVIILFCSIAYADQRTVVSFDDLSRLPLLAGSNQLRLANNDNPDYKSIVSICATTVENILKLLI
jgi:hypothetical protein